MEEDQHMDTVEIIWQIDAEISRLQQARVLLSESDSGEVKRKPGRPKGSGVAKTTPAAQPPKAIAHPRRKMSAAGRARIAAAMKARWAKIRRVAKKASGSAAKDVPVAAKRGGTKQTAKKATGKKVTTKKEAQSQATTAASLNS
jgi:hypothetical protein